jgi:hypothetical protein
MQTGAGDSRFERAGGMSSPSVSKPTVLGKLSRVASQPMLKPTNRHNLMWHSVNSRAANPIASATSIVMAALTAAPVWISIA